MTRTLSIISIVLLVLVALRLFIGRGARVWRASVRREFLDWREPLIVTREGIAPVK
jgi:hypothetical protein